MTPAAHGAPVLTATMRQDPADFRVDEIDGFEPSGSGEHLLLTIEKAGMNTAFVARLLAQWAGVDARAVGYAGLKDRHALTTQRFSVQLPGQARAGTGARKLPRGALAGNRFVLTLRDVSGDAAAIDARLQVIATRGVPNYFGEQRFGHDGGNVDKALRMFAEPRRRIDREQRAMLLSAARSVLFNRVLGTRVAAGDWDTGLEGEVWMLDGSRSVFGPEPPSDALAARVAARDIHPTAPLWGRGALRSAAEALARETAALEDGESLALRAGLETAGLSQERRATRLCPGDLQWSWPAPDQLQLAFALPAGCYATAVLAELGRVGNGAVRRLAPASPTDG